MSVFGPESGQPAGFDNDMYPPYCNPLYVMPEEIEVRVTMMNGEYYFPVSISKFAGKKPYLGGLKNAVTGITYHHGSSQTPTENKFDVKDTSNLRSRETQTYEYRTLAVQSYRESGTQMQRNDVALDTKKDVVVFARPYFTAFRLHELKVSKCIVIQRCWRGCMARTLAKVLRQRKFDYENLEIREKDERSKLDKEKRTQDMYRRLHPTSNQDFEVLYNELNSWRITEAAKIKATIPPGPERKQAMNELLMNETKSLQSIQLLKASSRKSDHSGKTEQLLDLMSKPHKWQLSNGEVTFVHTPDTVRAGHLLELYKSVIHPNGNIDDRLEVLLRLKTVMKDSAAELTQLQSEEDMDKMPGSKKNPHYAACFNLLRDITDLVDREADMLSRSRPVDTLKSLRTRMNNLLLQYLENPKFNKQAAQFVNLRKAGESILSSTWVQEKW